MTTTPAPLPDNVDVVVSPVPGTPSVSIPQEEQSVLAEQVLTPDEQEAVENGVEVTIEMDVTNADETVSAEDKEAVESCLDAVGTQMVIGQYLDVSLWKQIGENDPTAITDTFDTLVTVVITVPQGLQKENRDFFIIRVHDGVATLLQDLDTEDATITIRTSKFSTYAIAYEDASEPTPTPTPGLDEIQPPNNPSQTGWRYVPETGDFYFLKTASAPATTG